MNDPASFASIADLGGLHGGYIGGLGGHPGANIGGLGGHPGANIGGLGGYIGYNPNGKRMIGKSISRSGYQFHRA